MRVECVGHLRQPVPIALDRDQHVSDGVTPQAGSDHLAGGWEKEKTCREESVALWNLLSIVHKDQEVAPTRETDGCSSSRWLCRQKEVQSFHQLSGHTGGGIAPVQRQHHESRRCE